MNTLRDSFGLVGKWFEGLVLAAFFLAAMVGSNAHGHASGGGHQHSVSDGLGEGGSAGGLSSMGAGGAGVGQMPSNLSAGGGSAPPLASAPPIALTQPQSVPGTGANAVSRDLGLTMGAFQINSRAVQVNQPVVSGAGAAATGAGARSSNSAFRLEALRQRRGPAVLPR